MNELDLAIDMQKWVNRLVEANLQQQQITNEIILLLSQYLEKQQEILDEQKRIHSEAI